MRFGLELQATCLGCKRLRPLPERYSRALGTEDTVYVTDDEKCRHCASRGVRVTVDIEVK